MNAPNPNQPDQQNVDPQVDIVGIVAVTEVGHTALEPAVSMPASIRELLDKMRSPAEDPLEQFLQKQRARYAPGGSYAQSLQQEQEGK